MNSNEPEPFYSKQLADFCSNIQFLELPKEVVTKAEDLFVDWFGSALAGKGMRQVETIAAFARSQGPQTGKSEIIHNRESTSAFFAAYVNGAASHVAEQDDVHNGSVFHPAAVVFPAVLAVAQEIGASGKEFITAVVAGYETGIRIGEFLGRSHYKTFHTTGTVGSIAAAAAVGRLLKLDTDKMLDAFGSAGTQSAGLWEFLRDGADSKQLHTAHAASSGLASAYLPKEGFTGAKRILEGKQGLATGMSSDADPSRLNDALGTRWALTETSFKFHASCRHTHPAADALLKAMHDGGIEANDIKSVTALVHQGAIDVLGPVVEPANVHQAKFSMGTTLGLIACYGKAGMREFEKHTFDAPIAAFREKVTMKLDEEVDSLYPSQWIGKVLVVKKDGNAVEARVDEPKGDPGNTLSRAEIETKVRSLAAFGSAASSNDLDNIIPRLWSIKNANSIKRLTLP